MAYLAFHDATGVRLGWREGDRVADLTAIIGHRGLAAALDELGPETLLVKAQASPPRLSLSDLTLAIPVVDAEKIIGIGKNYAAHARELGGEPAKHPLIFLRHRGSFVAHGAPLVRPMISAAFDFEGELAVVMGKRCRHVSEDKALSMVAGYTVGMDGSVRDIQEHSFAAGKNVHSTGGLGPWVMAAKHLNPADLSVRTTLNGDVVQDGRTAEMIRNVPALVSYLSTLMVLNPGDVILTGTPAGVGWGRKPPLWLKPGDMLAVSIEGIGTLRHPVVAEAG